MPTYPNKKYDFQSACIQLNTDLYPNDRLYIKLGSKELSHIFNMTQVNQFKTNPDFELYILDCRITYDLEWHYVLLESLFRDHNFNYAYIIRDVNHRITNPIITPSSPPVMVFDLQTYNLKTNDVIDYYINNKSYYHYLEKLRIKELYTDDGYLINSLNHRLKVEDTNLGKKLYLIAGQSTDVFTAVGTFTDSHTYSSIISSMTLPSNASYAIFEIKDNFRLGDKLDFITSKGNTVSHVFTNSELDQLNANWQISFTDYKLRLIPIYHGPLRVYNIELTLLDNTDNILSATISQTTAYQYYFCDRFKHNYLVFTSNPVYDTSEEQLFHSKSELDHIKQRCICAIAGATSQLKDVNVYNQLIPTAQKIRDQVMDYIIYPNTCRLETKQYLWDNYGPFTSARPEGSPTLSYIDPSSGSYGQKTLGLYINLVFKDNVQLGTGNIYLYNSPELILTATHPLHNSLGNSLNPIIYLFFNQDIKLGFGKIILEPIEYSMAIIDGSIGVKLTGLITLSLVTNKKLYPGTGKLRLVPILT